MKDGLISLTVYNSLAEERAHQDRKFGMEPLATPEQLIAILGEEFGEICRCICQARSKAELNKEVRQLAAVGIAWLDGDLHWSNKSRERL